MNLLNIVIIMQAALIPEKLMLYKLTIFSLFLKDNNL